MREVIIIMEDEDKWIRRAMAEPEISERIAFFERISWEKDAIAIDSAQRYSPLQITE